FRGLRTATDEGSSGFEVFAVALKGFRSVGTVVGSLLDYIGKLIGGIGASLIALVSGDIKGAFDIAKQLGHDLMETDRAAAQKLVDIWTKSSKETVDEAGKFSAGLGSALDRVKNSGDGA